METYRRWKQRKSPESQRYYQVRPATRALIALTYIGLAAALGVVVAGAAATAARRLRRIARALAAR
jgi:hypothetical protein